MLKRTISEQGITALNTLTGIIKDVITPEIIGSEEKAEQVHSLCEDIIEGIEEVDDYTLEQKMVESLDDWDERAKGAVEFVRNGKRLTIPIQSLTAKEYDRLEIWRDNNTPTEPTKPSARPENKKNSELDKKYIERLKKFSDDKVAIADMYMFKVVDIGTPTITFDGSTDEEKLESFKSRPAGDVVKLFHAIMSVSNLTEDNILPFMTGSSLMS